MCVCVCVGGGGGESSIKTNPFHGELWIFCGPTFKKIVPH